MLVALLEPTDRDDIDSLSEELSEGLLEIHEIEQRAARLELDEEVDVAVRRIVTTSDRPEQRDRAATMTANDLVDLVPLRLDPSPALPHGLKGTEAVCAGLTLGPVPALRLSGASLRPWATAARSVFGAALRVHDHKTDAVEQVRDEGLASLTERWVLDRLDGEPEPVVCVIEANPIGVMLALDHA